MVLCSSCIRAIQIISMILGVVLNSLVLLVRVVKFYKRRRISSYHFIIVNIAVVDLVFAILINIDIQAKNNTWDYSLAACQISKTTNVIAGDIPALFMVLLAFERYQGTIKPLGQRFRLKTLVLISGIITFFTVGLYFPYGFYLQLTGTINDENRWCIPQYPFTGFDEYYRHILFAVFFALPVTITTILHLKIFFALKKHHTRMSKILSQTAVFHTKLCTSTSQEQHDTYPPSDRSSNDSVFLPIDNKENDNQSTFVRIAQKIKLCCGPSVLKTRKSNGKTPLQWGVKLKIHILVAISLAFFFCMFPLHLFHYLFIYKKLDTINTNVLVVFTWMRYLHCFVNGFVYSVLDERFRRDLLLILRSLLTCESYYKLDYRDKRKRPTSSHTSIELTSF